MPSTPKIPKETILQHALHFLLEEGYEKLNIKALASRIGCSTQPISWHFGNMDGLRTELAAYAEQYASQKMTPREGSPFTPFEQVGRAYIEIAMHEPNLFRFLYLGGYEGKSAGSLDTLTCDKELEKQLAVEFAITQKQAESYVQRTIIFTHGIATLVATGMLKASEEEIMEQVNQATDVFLLAFGVSKTVLKQKKWL